MRKGVVVKTTTAFDPGPAIPGLWPAIPGLWFSKVLISFAISGSLQIVMHSGHARDLCPHISLSCLSGCTLLYPRPRASASESAATVTFSAFKSLSSRSVGSLRCRCPGTADTVPCPGAAAAARRAAREPASRSEVSSFKFKFNVTFSRKIDKTEKTSAQGLNVCFG
jgi:hypothetical protein